MYHKLAYTKIRQKFWLILVDIITFLYKLFGSAQISIKILSF